MKLILFIMIGALHNSLFAQNLPISNQVTLGGSDYEGPFREPLVTFADDGSLFTITNSQSNVSGTKTENSRGMYDIWITKLNENHIPIWDKTIGGDQVDYVSDAKIVSDLIYVLSTSDSGISGDKTIGSFDSEGSGDLWMICLDLNGNVLWQDVYGGNSGDGNGRFISYTDTSLMIVCSSSSPISGNKTVGLIQGTDLWMLEISKLNGQIIQQKGFGSNGYDDTPSIYRSPINSHLFILCETDGGLSGDKTEESFGQRDLWLIELDDNLNIIKEKAFGGSYNEEAYANNLVFDDNGLMYLTAESFSGVSGNKTASNFSLVQFTSDYWLLKLDESMNIIWDKVYGGLGNDIPNSIFKNINNQYILGGMSRSGIGGNKTSLNFNTTLTVTFDGWMLILDPDGQIVQQSAYGGGINDFTSFQAYGSSNQDILLLSISDSPISGNKTVGTYGFQDVWLAKIDASEFLNTSNLTKNVEIAVYPNPFTDEVHFNFAEIKGDCQLSLYSMDGKLVHSETVTSGVTQKTVNIPNGQHVVLYELKNEDFIQTGKLIRN